MAGRDACFAYCQKPKSSVSGDGSGDPCDLPWGPPSLQVPLTVELKETAIVFFFVLFFSFPATQGSLPRCPAAKAEAVAVAVTGECTLQRQEEEEEEERKRSVCY